MSAAKVPLWVPQRINDTNIAKFLAYINQKHNSKLQTYEEIHEWSVNEKTTLDFWRDAYIWLELCPGGMGNVGRVLDTEVS